MLRAMLELDRSSVSPRSARRFARLAVFLSLGVLGATSACDDKSAPAAKDAAPPPSAAPSAAPVEEAPTSTVLSMDDKALTVNGTKVLFEGPDVRGRLSGAVVGKPKVAGETVSLAVVRTAKAAKVALVVAALKEAKASSVVVKAQKRDNAMSEILVGWDAAPPCAAVATIGKDVSISVWTVGGTVAKRFAKGMAGPDVTLGSEGLRKVAGACESPIAFLAGDESVSFGLLFDLALATKDTEDKRIAALKFGLPVDSPVPGRKVTP